jgi:cysteine desulfurase
VRAYLDHGADAPLDPRVRAAMLPWLDRTGSPMGLHDPARAAADALEAARDQVARLAAWPPAGVVFTAGATEARSLAVRGALAARGGGRVVASAVEHAATLAACRSAARGSDPPLLVGVDAEGLIDPAALAAALEPETALVCLVHGQPEVGALQDLGALIAIVRDRAPGAVVVADCEETAGVIALDGAAEADLVVLGGRAMGAPAWSGALLVRPGTPLHPLIDGGPEEGGKRGGPHALPGIVALGEAARLAPAEMAARATRMAALRDRLADRVLSVPDVRLNGPPPGPRRLPGHLQASAGWVEAETLVLALAARGVACSPGSACTAGAGKASPVLEAMGLDAPWTHSAVLFTLGPRSTEAEVDHAGGAFADAVAALRRMSPLTPR